MNKIVTKLLKSVRCRAKYALLRYMTMTSSLWPDEVYLKVRYRIYFGRKLNLCNPKSFNEKIQWLKLNYCPSDYSIMVDKYEVKKYIANLIGEQYIIPTLGVWDSADKVDFELLPDQFVIKCNHNSGLGMYICKDKAQMNISKVRQGLQAGLKEKFYKMAHEMQYKNVKPLIIAEKYMEDESGFELKDYKFFCFNGNVKFVKVDFDRFVGKHRANYYDLDWNLLPFEEVVCPRDINKLNQRPKNLDLMIDIAKRLSKDIPFVRVDLYNIDGKIYFGELTFTPNGGMGPFNPDEWDYKIGSYLQLPQKNV